MKTNNKIIILASIFFILSICFFVKGFCYKPYEYIDMQNKKGIAKKCYTTNDNVLCKVDNKTIIVKQYCRR